MYVDVSVYILLNSWYLSNASGDFFITQHFHTMCVHCVRIFEWINGLFYTCFFAFSINLFAPPAPLQSVYVTPDSESNRTVCDEEAWPTTSSSLQFSSIHYLHYTQCSVWFLFFSSPLFVCLNLICLFVCSSSQFSSIFLRVFVVVFLILCLHPDSILFALFNIYLQFQWFNFFVCCCIYCIKSSKYRISLCERVKWKDKAREKMKRN